MKGYRLKALNLLGKKSIFDLLDRFLKQYPDQATSPCKASVVCMDPFEVEFIFSDKVVGVHEESGFTQRLDETPEFAIRKFVSIVLMKKTYRCKLHRDYDMLVVN